MSKEKAPVVKNIPIADVLDIPDEKELRAVKRGTFDDFCKQLQQEKLVQAIAVRPHRDQDGKYQLIDGRHRAAAYRRNAVAGGRRTIRAEIHDVDDQELRLMQVVANVQRTDYTPYEEAVDLQLMVDAGLKQTEIAKRIGKAQSHVSKRLKLLQLPPFIADHVGEDLDIKDAMHFAPATRDEQLLEAVQEVARAQTSIWRLRNHPHEIIRDAAAQAGMKDAFNHQTIQPAVSTSPEVAFDIIKDATYRKTVMALGDAIEFGPMGWQRKHLLLTRKWDAVVAAAEKALVRVESRRGRAAEKQAKERAAFEGTPEGQEAMKRRKAAQKRTEEEKAKTAAERQQISKAKDLQLQEVWLLPQRCVDPGSLMLALVDEAFQVPYNWQTGCLTNKVDQDIIAGILGEYAPKKAKDHGDKDLAKRLLQEDPERGRQYVAAVLFFQARVPLHGNASRLVDSSIAPAATGKTKDQVLKDARKQIAKEATA